MATMTRPSSAQITSPAVHSDTPGRRAGEGRAAILIVDDDEPIRRVLTGLIERHGYRCTAAADALTCRRRCNQVSSIEEAVNLVRRGCDCHFDPDLLDLHLDGRGAGDQHSVCRRIGKRRALWNARSG